MAEELFEMVKLGLQAPSILKEIYNDLAKPGVSQVGRAIESILGLGNTILWPIAIINEKAKIALQTNLEKYRKRLEKVHEDQIVSVAPEIGTPILEKLSYVTNNELSDLFIELLAKASIEDQTKKAHPSFVNIINSLSPDEAIIIRYFSTRNDEPWIEVRRNSRKENFYSIVANMWSNLNKVDDLVFKDNISYYINNLEGLGLLYVRQDITIKDDAGAYEQLENDAYEYFKGWENEDIKLGYKRGVIGVKAFGRLFMNACIKKN